MNNKNRIDDQIFLIDEDTYNATLYQQEPLDTSYYQKSANQITQSLLDAMRIVSHRQIIQADFNKIVKANIVDCEDESLGKYKVQYQDGSWYAYNENLSNQYTPGTSVYVMVPNSNMQEDKIIIGSSKQVDQTYITIKSELDNFVSNGYNLLSLNDNISNNNQDNWKLWSEYPEEIVLYQNSNKLNSILKFDETSFNIQKNDTNRLLLQATIQTSLPPSRQYGGNYGIGIDIIFKNKSNKQQEVQRSYILDVDNIIGDPYVLISPTTQRLLFEIDGENFVKINKIYLFIKDFTNDPENEKGNNYNVVISNLSLTNGREVSEQEKNGVLLSLKSLKGFTFGDNSLNTDTRQIQAEMKVQLKEIKLKNQKLPFYWFVENARVTSNSDGYCKYGGQGWYCLNQKSEKNEYIPSNYKYTVTCGDIYTLKTKYKCVVLYNGISYSKEFVITKLNSEYKIELSSSKGTEFYKDIGKTTLICTVFGKNNNEFQQIPSNNFDFIWTSINKFGNFESLQSQINQIQNLNISTIVDFTTFKCSVFQKSNSGALIGTATILITNKVQNEQDYSLIINNGDQVFKYNVDGISPAVSKYNVTPQVIPALTFTVYDNLGNPIEEQNLREVQITWIIPIKNTLLRTSEIGGVPDATEEMMSYRNVGNVFSYSIADNYSFNNTNNNIILKIIYNGLNLMAKTNFSFLKQGENGTNGTNFVCKIIPNTTNNSIPINPTIYCRKISATGYEWFTNWGGESRSDRKMFKVQLWQNGKDQPIFDGTDSNELVKVTWSVLKNKYSNTRSDPTSLLITNEGNTSQDNWKFWFTNSDIQNDWSEQPTGSSPGMSYRNWFPANIIQVALTYNKMTYYATLPIIVCRIFEPGHNLKYKPRLKDYSGFREVLYNSNGLSPQYDSHAPFEIIISKNGTDIESTDSEFNNLNFAWFYIGNTWVKNGNNWQRNYEETSNGESILGTSTNKWLSLGNTPIGFQQQKNQKFIKPVDNYDGECVTTAIACEIYSGNSAVDGTVYAWIHIPIHMMRNRFENAAINGWDGNHIDLGDNEEGMILAPQIGAGTKNNQNKFTGIVMGSTKQTGKIETGLFGYHQGSRSIFLDAETGKAEFGENGKSQIKIDPTNNTATIQSGNYDTTNGTGMLIDLSTPEIKFGSGLFSVNQYGRMNSKSGYIGNWWIEDYQIRQVYVADDGTGHSIAAASTGMNSMPIVNETGSKTISTKVPPSGNDSNYTQKNKAIAFWAGGVTPKFFVTHDGYLKTSQASIGSGTNPIFIGGSGSQSYIFSGKKSSKTTLQNGFYIGTNGLGIGSGYFYDDGTTSEDLDTGEITHNGTYYSNFQVDTNGTFYARAGYIGKRKDANDSSNHGWWKIQDYSICNGKTSLDNNDQNGVYLGTDGIALGKITVDNTNYPAFKVDRYGSLIASKGTIANWTISKNSIRTNNASDRYYSSGSTVDTTGIYFGNQGLRMGANFHVDQNGNLYANNGKFTGEITATSGTFNGSVFSYGTETGYTSRYAELSNNRLSFKNDSGTVYAYFTTNESANAANEQGNNSLLSTTGIRADNSHLLLSAYGDNRSNIALVAQNRIILAPQNTGLVGGGYAVWVRDGNTLTMCTVTSNQIWSDGGGTSSLRYKNISHELTSKEIQNFYFVKPIWGSYKEDYLKEKNQEYLKNVFMPMLIAEDIEKIYPKAVYYNKNGQVQNYYDHLVVSVHQKMLIDQHQEIKNLKQQIELLKQQIKGG